MNAKPKTIKKNITLLLISLPFVISAQIQNPKIQRSETPACEIMKIDVTDSATHIFFKCAAIKKYPNGGWICAGENFSIKDNQTKKKYKMINSINIPTCPYHHQFDNINQVHYFSLSFQPIPKDTKEIDVIEDPAGGLNFYDVSLIQNGQIDKSINYIDLLKKTPVKEVRFIIDGKNDENYVHKGSTAEKSATGTPILLTRHLLIAEHDLPQKMKWKEAKKACEKLGKDWRLPTYTELQIIYKNKEIIAVLSLRNIGVIQHL